MGEWKKKKILNQPLFTWVEVGLFLAVGVLLGFMFLALASSVKSRSKKVIPAPVIPIPVSIGEFKSRRGSFGSQKYVVSVQKSVDDGTRMFRPIAGCPDFLIVDVKLPIKDSDGKFRDKLARLDGVADVKIYGYKILIHRPCVSTLELPQLWSWEEVWKEVAPVLEEYFNPKK
jgi:hypothetical protein